MINGTHVIIYSTDAEADRRFIGEVLGFGHVDAGDGWLIFAAPPAEVAVHPTEGPSSRPEGRSGPGTHELYLMCDDVEATVKDLTAKGATFATPVTDQGWGLMTAIALPGGGGLGLYQPRHPTAHQ